MKIVAIEEFEALPVGTVFCEWTPNVMLTDWSVKFSEGDNAKDHWSASLIETEINDQDEGSKWTPKNEFSCSSARNCYIGPDAHGRKHLFMILEKADLLVAIGRINECIKMLDNPGYKPAEAP